MTFANASAIRRALENAGVELIEENGGGLGARLRRGLEETERVWQGQSSRKFPREIQVRALRKLRQLDAAATIEDLRNPPGNRLELLKGKRAGQMSIRINDQWRICFRWVEKDAEDVEIVDYH